MENQLQSSLCATNQNLSQFKSNFSKLLCVSRISKSDIAGMFSIGEDIVDQWLSGESEPDLSLLSKLCEYFEVNVDTILNGDVANYYFNKAREKSSLDNIATCPLSNQMLSTTINIADEINKLRADFIKLQVGQAEHYQVENRIMEYVNREFLAHETRSVKILEYVSGNKTGESIN